jgi:uncharacterized protein (DUF1330 family)
MAAYLIVDTKLTNPELYELYKLKAKPLLEQYGGEYLARGGALSVKEDTLWTPTRMVLVKFPSVQAAETFYQSDEYQDVLKISRQSADRTMVIVEGI